jgi:hypothetical protein
MIQGLFHWTLQFSNTDSFNSGFPHFSLLCPSVSHIQGHATHILKMTSDYPIDKMTQIKHLPFVLGKLGEATVKLFNFKKKKKRNQQGKVGDKHIKKNSRLRSNRISVVVVLVLLLQHPVVVLVFKQKLCLSLIK